MLMLIKNLLLLIVCCAPAVLAQPTLSARIRAQCDAEMAAQVCSVRNDADDYAGAQSILLGRLGRVPLATYLRVRAAGDGMCALVESYCAAAPDGDECRIARSRWGGE